MRLLIFIFSLFLSACKFCDESQTITQSIINDAVIIPQYTDIAISVMSEKMPCDATLKGDIYWFNSPLDKEAISNCGIPAWGCADPWSCRFSVWIATYNPNTKTHIENVWSTALVNEIGYWVWYKCYNRNLERYIGGVEFLDPDFNAWIKDVNSEIQRRASSAL